MNDEIQIFDTDFLKSISALESIYHNLQVTNFLGIQGILEKNLLTEAFESEVSTYLQKNIQVKSNWLNILIPTQLDNHFHWHTDSQYPGTHLGIYWPSGDPNSGGDLMVHTDSEIQNIIFKPGRLTIFPIRHPHQVTHYSGKNPRLALSFTF